MPCHQKAIDRMIQRLRTCPRENVDFWLDKYIDVTTLATEWDADQWGFRPDQWMQAEREEMNRRAGGGGVGLWPRE